MIGMNMMDKCRSGSANANAIRSLNWIVIMIIIISNNSGMEEEGVFIFIFLFLVYDVAVVVVVVDLEEISWNIIIRLLVVREIGRSRVIRVRAWCWWRLSSIDHHGFGGGRGFGVMRMMTRMRRRRGVGGVEERLVGSGIDALTNELLAQVSVPVVLYLIICASRNSPCYQRPPICIYIYI